MSELKVSASLVMDFEQVGDDIIPVSLSTDVRISSRLLRREYLKENIFENNLPVRHTPHRL